MHCFRVPDQTPPFLLASGKEDQDESGRVRYSLQQGVITMPCPERTRWGLSRLDGFHSLVPGTPTNTDRPPTTLSSVISLTIPCCSENMNEIGVELHPEAHHSFELLSFLFSGDEQPIELPVSVPGSGHYNSYWCNK